MDDTKILEIDINTIQTFIFECISELRDDEEIGHIASRVYNDLDGIESEMLKRLTRLRKALAKDM